MAAHLTVTRSPALTAGSTARPRTARGAGLGLVIGDSIVRSTGGRWQIGDSPLGGALMAVSWRYSQPHRPSAQRLAASNTPGAAGGQRESVAGTLR